ncbi:MAG TPA: UDP-N-acetylglucosamine 2-epimerase (non-hydrolyzing) [Bacteroidales bacterium]|jgi:UDP-N-acetylglucosamine 2-epimerase (non-hydrolysing)|nr:UDP-N-acetylglucosamine 2-epimerase (non-hydrolyzing) [Bacteroidales bacterium]HOS71370.1 UDP-N-acetylglucosamine 2-epimerase (non-hydrolyzing) [Bacteroidales bacterium]
MRVISVVGARPNFMKIAPFIRAVEKYNREHDNYIDHILVHTGQHYDIRMSEAFFRALEIPEPCLNLEIGSGTHAEQLGHTMIEFEKVLRWEYPDWVVVVGDVNATLSCSVVAKKFNVKLCHIEAGLRSGDMTMPEEINRLVTDRLSDLLFTPDLISSENLRKEGVPEEKIFFAGNIMIDTLESNRIKAENLSVDKIISDNLIEGRKHSVDFSGNGDYALMTLHRPSNVDDEDVFFPLIKFLSEEVTKNFPLIWAVHPRARKQLEKNGWWDYVMSNPALIILEPVGYHEMLRLNMGARLMLTDSGGLQEECTVLGTPCITLRYNTERPVTLREHGGLSVLTGNNLERIREEFLNALDIKRKPVRPELWDGHAAERIVEKLVEFDRRPEPR